MKCVNPAILLQIKASHTSSIIKSYNNKSLIDYNLTGFCFKIRKHSHNSNRYSFYLQLNKIQPFLQLNIHTSPNYNYNKEHKYSKFLENICI